MAVSYNAREWKNGASGGTSIDAENLNRMEEGIQDTVNAVNGLLSGSAAKAKDLAPTTDIPASSDLDDYTEAGSYSCSAEASATVTNKPDAVEGAFLLYVYEGPGEGLTHEIVASDGRTWSRPVPGEWYEMSGHAMESFGEVLWNGRIAKGGKLTIPDANRYGVMAVSYSSHAPVGLAMHCIATDGLHVISGFAGAASSGGLASRGFSFSSSDGVTWTANDVYILSTWGSGAEVQQQALNATETNTLTIWGVVPSDVTKRVLTS